VGLVHRREVPPHRADRHRGRARHAGGGADHGHCRIAAGIDRRHRHHRFDDLRRPPSYRPDQAVRAIRSERFQLKLGPPADLWTRGSTSSRQPVRVATRALQRPQGGSGEKHLFAASYGARSLRSATTRGHVDPQDPATFVQAPKAPKVEQHPRRPLRLRPRPPSGRMPFW
jgi:hypothetical protein